VCHNLSFSQEQHGGCY